MNVLRKLWRHLVRSIFRPATFSDYLRLFLTSRQLSRIESKLDLAWHLTRWVAGELNLHEDHFVSELADLCGYEYLARIPTLDLESQRLDLERCKKCACLPVKIQNQYVGIAFCHPALLPQEVGTRKISSRLFLVSVGTIEAAFSLLDEQLAKSSFGITPQDAIDLRVVRKQIILVDDNPVFLRAAESVLKRYQLASVSYSDPELFIRDLDCGKLDLGNVITDLNMPMMSGFELIQQLTARGVTASSIYLATSDESTETERIARQLGVENFIRKSGGPDLFATYIEKSLKSLGRVE
jgi:CheY-like chemotaxis protein